MNIRPKSIKPTQKMIKQRESKTVTVISLQQENLKLQKQVVLLQQKILKLDKQNFTQKQQILKLQVEKLKPRNKIKSLEEINQVHAQVAAIDKMEHNEPPEN